MRQYRRKTEGRHIFCEGMRHLKTIPILRIAVDDCSFISLVFAMEVCEGTGVESSVVESLRTCSSSVVWVCVFVCVF